MTRTRQTDPSAQRYAALEARVKHVPEATIRKKWKKLPSSNHIAIREVILSAKEQSVNRRGKAGTSIAVEACVEEVATKLMDRLPRIPLPPSTDEHHFDHEANLSRTAKIEEQLSANTHSMNLLRAQIAKEEELLKQDEAEVEQLEQSLKSNKAYRRDQAKSLHPSARKLGCGNVSIDLLKLVHEDTIASRPSVMGLLQDEDMQTILLQLQDHLDTMQANLSDVKEVKKVVSRAPFELEDYTFSRSEVLAQKEVADLVSVDQT